MGKHSHSAGRYRMISSMSIKGFRCFREVSLSPLGRVNVIVGDNGSGKTSLLEALFIMSGSSPDLTIKTRAWRGIDSIEVTDDPQAAAELWGDLFHEFDRNRPIEMEANDTKTGRRRVVISGADQGDVLLAPSTQSDKVMTRTAPISFEYIVNGNSKIIVPEFTDKGLRLGATGLPTIKGRFMAANFSAKEYARIFSALSQGKRDREIVDLLRSEFPRIENLSVEILGQDTMIFASASGIPRKIPVVLLSAGINKLLCILLSIANLPGGVVMIDEIENGFYYERMPSIWRMIRDFAERYETQVFASTHSRECLVALSDVYADAPQDACLLRVEQHENTSHVLMFPGEMAFGALKFGEVR